MADTPTVSIIIPVKPGGAVTALADLDHADYPAEALEILVAEGRSPSLQRNEAAAVAGGDILYFLDDDSRVTPGFLRRAVRHYTDPKVAAVGGPSLTPESDSSLQQAFGMTFASIIGGGGMRNRYQRTGTPRSTGDHELILCNLSFRRDIFLSNGGFDQRLYPNEENELMDRLKRGGSVLIHDPEVAVHRSQRRTLTAFCRQLFGYGRGRGEQTVISGKVKPVTLVPSLFLLYLLVLPFVARPLYALPLLCYIAVTIAFSVYQGFRSGRAGSAAWLLLVVPLFHICYGLGMIRGLVLHEHSGRKASSADVTLRRVKAFGGELADLAARSAE